MAYKTVRQAKPITRFEYEKLQGLRKAAADARLSVLEFVDTLYAKYYPELPNHSFSMLDEVDGVLLRYEGD